MKKPPLVSLVVPVFNEEETIPLLLDALAKATEHLMNYAWELVLVDDGSHDGTVEAIGRFRETFPHPLTVVRLSRNFGHQPALSAGLSRAEGQAVICLDADLQDPPELFAQFLEKWEQGFDVVYAVRRTRQESHWKKLCYSAFYRLMKGIGNVDVPLDAGDFGLMSRRVVELICEIPERDVFLRGLRSWVGFKQTGVPYDRPARCAGDTKYSLPKLFRLASSALFGYSLVPLRLATALGGAVIVVSSCYFAWGALSKLLYNNTPPGWASLVGVISFLSGSQLVFLGILGEYVGRIYAQSNGRPLYIVRGETLYNRSRSEDRLGNVTRSSRRGHLRPRLPEAPRAVPDGETSPAAVPHLSKEP